MPTNAVILDNAPIACVLAGNDIANGQLFGARPDPELAGKIYAVYTIIKKIYDKDPSYSGMTQCCLYLWEICGKYGIRAMAYSGNGGSVAPITPGIGYSYYDFQYTITSGNNNTHTFQHNDLISGQQIKSMTVNSGTLQTLLGGDFSVNTVTGTITWTQLFFTGDIVVIPFLKLVS